jgi:pimeloyl-ACP methyl ester carboxylesterase
MRLEEKMDLPRLARALVDYCDEVGVEKATFVGNSLGCPIICALASDHPERIERAVLVSPAGGPNNRPLAKALGQMALDGPREPMSMVPIAVRDYLHFGVFTSLSLFKAMTRFPTIERLHQVHVPTLAIAGERDPLVDLDRVSVFTGMQHVHAVAIPGAHALNYSEPEVVAALIEAHIDGAPLRTDSGPLANVRELHIPS